MRDILTAKNIADIVETIRNSGQPTCIEIADEVIQSQSPCRIAEVHLASCDQSIDLPTISFPIRKRGYIAALSPTDEEKQLSQVCILILVVLERIALDEYDALNSTEELLNQCSEYEWIFNKIRSALASKELPVL